MNYKYYIIQSSNGNVSIKSEWDDINKAIVAFHQLCATLWNAQDVIEGIVEIVYSMDLNVVSSDGSTFRERITHPQEPTPEPETSNEG